MKFTYYGTRGSLSVPHKDKEAVGANTLCVDVLTAAGGHLILDAGLGIIELGNNLMANLDVTQPNEFHIVFSHYHWDHIQGLQFFRPIYYPTSTINLYSPLPVAFSKKAIENLFRGSYCPFESLYNLPSTINFKKIPKHGMSLLGTAIRFFEVDHTTTTFAYRIEEPQSRLVYATDHEAGDVKINQPFIAFCKNADVIIHDAMYTQPEYKDLVGFGHCTVEKAIQNGIDAQARQLHLFHHDIGRTDKDLNRYIKEYKKNNKDRLKNLSVQIAREGDHYTI